MGEPTVAVVVDQLRQRPTSGIATYSRGLLQGLAAMGDTVPVTLVASRPPQRGGDPLDAWGWPVRSSRLPGPALVRLWGAGVGRRLVAGTDVVHATSLAVPLGGGAPMAVMVHDLAFREVPDAFPASARRWHEAAFRRALSRAAALATPSERSAAAVIDAGASPDRVVVIPEGCDHLPLADTDGASALLRSLGVTTPYLLSVSTLEPRKNLARLVEAYQQARDRLPEPWPLVVVGPQGWGPALLPTPGVKLAGVVTDAVLAALYAGARCLAYVPLLEGWGLPPVEAMAACTPVVASPMPSTGGAALEVDPDDTEAIAAAVILAAGDDRRRSELVTAGLIRARELTWEGAARRHVEMWRRLAA
ncbi:MAG TPA: glycosyltransferase family 1 protein [Acidimicrobiales bacterium]